MLVLLIISACTSKYSRNISELNYLLDSLKTQYAPDTRIELWNLSVNKAEGIIHLSGEVADKETFRVISEFVSERFKEVKNELILLPEDENGRIVNGLITNSVGQMRSEPRHMADIVSQALLGTPVRILKRERDWCLVQTPNLYLGWIDSAAVEPINTEELLLLKQSKKIIYNRQYGFSYSEPNDRSMAVSDLVIGCILNVRVERGGFYNVEYPDGRIAWVKKSEAIEFDEVLDRTPEKKALIETALKFNGVPYLWGGASSKALDCSGFSSMIYFMNGMQLMRDASQQVHCGELISSEYKYDELEVGDLLFFGRRANDTQAEKVSHVAMYIGDSEFIHASGRVRINSMNPEKSNFIPEYPGKFIRTMRIIGIEDEGCQPVCENKFYKEII